MHILQYAARPCSVPFLPLLRLVLLQLTFVLLSPMTQRAIANLLQVRSNRSLNIDQMISCRWTVESFKALTTIDNVFSTSRMSRGSCPQIPSLPLELERDGSTGSYFGTETLFHHTSKFSQFFGNFVWLLSFPSANNTAKMVSIFGNSFCSF